MNNEERDHKIKELIQKLKVKADSHKGKGWNMFIIFYFIYFSGDVVDYSSSLTALNELIDNTSELVELVPVILTGVIPHTTRHYWTNESSILAAKSKDISTCIMIIITCIISRYINLYIKKMSL